MVFLRTGPPSVGGEDDLRPARPGDAEFGVAVNIAVGVPADDDGPLPGRDEGMDVFREDGGAEDRSVEKGADGPVRALPLFLQVVFPDPVLRGGDGGALDPHAVFHDRPGGIDCYPVIRFIPMFDVEIVIIQLDVEIGQDEVVLDELPHDPGHFVAVHFHQRGFYLNLLHMLSIS